MQILLHHSLRWIGCANNTSYINGQFYPSQYKVNLSVGFGFHCQCVLCRVLFRSAPLRCSYGRWANFRFITGYIRQQLTNEQALYVWFSSLHVCNWNKSVFFLYCNVFERIRSFTLHLLYPLFIVCRLKSAQNRHTYLVKKLRLMSKLHRAGRMPWLRYIQSKYSPFIGFFALAGPFAIFTHRRPIKNRRCIDKQCLSTTLYTIPPATNKCSALGAQLSLTVQVILKQWLDRPKFTGFYHLAFVGWCVWPHGGPGKWCERRDGREWDRESVSTKWPCHAHLTEI